MRIGRDEAGLAAGVLDPGSGEVRLAFRYADLPLSGFDRAQWRHGFMRLGLGPVAMWAGVFLVCGLAAGWIEAAAGPRGEGAALFVMIGAGLGASSLFAGFLIRWAAMQRASRRAELSCGLRAGLHEVTLGPGGLRVRADNTDCRHGWTAVSSIGQARGGLVLRLGTRHYVPLPDAALPDGLSRDALLDRIHGWKAG